MSTTSDRNDPGINVDRGDGQNKTYLVLTDDERANGFVRPVRKSYVHLICGGRTKIGLAIAETYARNPTFYGATFCCHCGKHFVLRDADGSHSFVWDDGSPVGD